MLLARCSSANALTSTLCTETLNLMKCTTANGANTLISHRSAYTKFPSFEDVRHNVTVDIRKAARESEDHRRAIPSAIYYGVGGTMALITAKESIQGIVAFKAMAADQQALASIEVKMEDIPEGQTKTYEWQGKPVFVKHRTAKEIQHERETAMSELRHPESDEQRVRNPEWSVMIGVCTHLGCVPIAGAGDFPGGYFCPCHGSHFDAAGRIRKGPAPLNLNIPPYSFHGDTIVIGTPQ